MAFKGFFYFFLEKHTTYKMVDSILNTVTARHSRKGGKIGDGIATL